MKYINSITLKNVTESNVDNIVKSLRKEVASYKLRRQEALDSEAAKQELAQKRAATKACSFANENWLYL